MACYRTGRHNRQELIYWQPGPYKSADDDELRFVIAKGPITGSQLCEALNTLEALKLLQDQEERKKNE